MSTIKPTPHPETTDASVRRDLERSLAARGVSAGLTWGDFQSAMAQLGVQATDGLASIDYGCGSGGTGRIVREDAPDGIEIREGRS